MKNKEFALTNPSHNSNSHSLCFLANATSSAVQGGATDDTVKKDQQSRVITTELLMGGANWSSNTIIAKETGETRDAER